MKEGSPCPFDTFRRHMHLAAAHGFDQKHLPTFTMHEDRAGFSVFGKDVKLERVASGFQACFDDLRRDLEKLLEDVPMDGFENVDWQDCLPKDDPGYSFLDSPGVAEMRTRGLKAKINDPNWFIPGKDGNPPRWNIVKVREWMKLGHSIHSRIIIIIHWGFGQPARITELTSMMHRNMQNAMRALFMTVDGLVSILGYNKVSF